MTQQTRVWVHGLGSSFIGAFAGSLGPLMIAPQVFNLTTLIGFRNTLLSSLFSAVSTTLAYLRNSPLPPMRVVEEASQVTDGNVTATTTKTTTTNG